ncbi:hypothetical protein [Streptomyces sp. NPDC002671]
MNSSETTDYFALLDASTDDAGRRYVSDDGISAMLRGMTDRAPSFSRLA